MTIGVTSKHVFEAREQVKVKVIQLMDALMELNDVLDGNLRQSEKELIEASQAWNREHFSELQ